MSERPCSLETCLIVFVRLLGATLSVNMKTVAAAASLWGLQLCPRFSFCALVFGLHEPQASVSSVPGTIPSQLLVWIHAPVWSLSQENLCTGKLCA